MNKSPCKNCRFRSVRPNCHETCEEYQVFNREREAVRQKRKADSLIMDYLKHRKRVNQRKKR